MVIIAMMNVERWRAQLLKGAAEFAVLGILDRRAEYGLAIFEQISAAGGVDVAEGSIYPLLNRLEKDRKIASEWSFVSASNHPRKYYRLTNEGRALLREMRDQWARFRAGVEKLTGETK